MNEAEPPETPPRPNSGRNGGNVTPFARRTERASQLVPQPPAPLQISFNRAELREILGLYGRRVAEGEWRDYAINFTPHKAIFSVFRRSSEMPLYRIEKDPALAGKQGVYAVIVATGLILRRGNDLTRVLVALEKRPKLVLV